MERRMAVQKSRKSRSKRNHRQRAVKLSCPSLNIDPVTGEQTLRHHVTSSGFYKGKKVVMTQADQTESDE